MKRSSICVRASLALLASLVAASSASAAAPASNAVYDATCALCHQVRGAGLKGQFPRLAGRADQMAANPESRLYLVQTVLHGLAGKIEVDGAPMVGVMPGFASLSDADIASVMNYIVSLGKPGKTKPFTAAEIATVRKAPPITMAQLLERRAELVAKGQVP